MTGSGPALEVVDLVKAYSGRVVVDRVSLTLRPATVLALLGPNGAGKTTTVETCEGFRRPDAGSVRVLGLDPIRDRAALAPRVGVMLQSGGVHSGARAGEMLRLLAALHARPLDPDLLLERLGLSAVAGTTYRRLSGGQQQRLALAMAVVGRPELVVLDEPTAGLDPHARHATWDLVRELRAAGVSVLLTTHALDEAEVLADDVVIVDEGRVVADGTPAELVARGGPRALRFRAPPALDTAALSAALPGDLRVVEETAGRYAVAGGDEPDVVAAVTSWCARAGVRVDELTTGHRSLEDVFLDLTGRRARP